LQLSGRQPRPPPLQTKINAKILKISPEWRWILKDELFLDLFTEFELHPSNSFRENRCLSQKCSFLNMIGAKLSDQRNSRNASRLKSNNQRLAYRGSPPRFSCRSNPPEEAKR